MAHELWTAHQQKIYDELSSLAECRQPVSLQDDHGHYATSRMRALVRRKPETYLVLNRPRQLTGVQAIERIVYKRLNSPFIFFDARMIRATEKLLSCRMPQALYYLQRRRFPRYAIKNRGSASFFLNRRARVCHMQLADLSLSGARLQGVPRYDLRTSDLVGPATLSIASADNFFVREMTISQGAVVRSAIKKDDSYDVGLHFKLDQREQKAMADLLSDPFAQLIFL